MVSTFCVLAKESLPTPAFLCLIMHDISFHIYLLSILPVLLYLKSISWWQPVLGSCLFIQSENVCLWTGVFSLFNVKSYNYWYGELYVYNLAICFIFFHMFFLPFCLLSCILFLYSIFLYSILSPLLAF